MTRKERNSLWTAINLCEGIHIKTGDKDGDRDLTEEEIMELLNGLESLGATWNSGDLRRFAA